MSNLKDNEGTVNKSDRNSQGEYQRQIEIANTLENALEFIRTVSRTNDYFTGYSLNEIIQERIELIGPDDDNTDTTVGESSKGTLVAMLNQLLVATVGEGPKHDGGAIQRALELDYIKNLSDEQTELTDD